MTLMPFGHSLRFAALAFGFWATAAAAHDQSKYPDMYGQWMRAHQRSQWDPSKARGLAQQAPLTPEYQAIFEENLKALRESRHDVDPQLRCIPAGVPRMMIAYEPLEFIVTASATYIRTDHLAELRRIYTDGRVWPASVQPAFEGYSIGQWVDENGDGRYDALVVETRGFKGPRAFDSSGLPLHDDNQTIVKERIYRDKSDSDLLHNEITTIDNALTRPWTVTRSYRREHQPVWIEHICGEDNRHVEIGSENYLISFDGFLMPTRKDQPPPDLRHFEPARK
jgi:hypothetical protein